MGNVCLLSKESQMITILDSGEIRKKSTIITPWTLFQRTVSKILKLAIRNIDTIKSLLKIKQICQDINSPIQKIPKDKLQR